MADRKATATKATKLPPSKAAAKKDAAAKKTPAKAAAAKKAPARAYTRREDLGAPVDTFFERHSPQQRALLEALHAMIRKAAPGARESIKWGMPYFELKGGICSLYTSPTYVGLNIMAPPEKLDDPEGKLEGTGKTMRHLKVRSAADLDEASILRWLKVAVALRS